MSNILVFAGKKQSGKTSACNFVTGLKIREAGIVKKFNLSDKGQLLVNTNVTDPRGNVTEQMGILDLQRQDYQFVDWAVHHIWPYVRTFNFADSLKIIAVQVFGLEKEKVYGSDDDKNSPTHLKWSDFSFVFNPKVVSNIKKEGKIDKFMTVRDFLQVFGTDVCRRIFPNCWAQSTFNRIKFEESDLNLIGDCRFRNELDYSKEHGAKVVKLEKKSEDVDYHKSETDLDDVDQSVFDLVIPDGTSLQDKNDMIYYKLLEWGWLGVET